VNASASADSDADELKSNMQQVQLCAPWANQSEVKQSLVLHSFDALQSVRYLQIEKLYRSLSGSDFEIPSSCLFIGRTWRTLTAH